MNKFAKVLFTVGLLIPLIATAGDLVKKVSAHSVKDTMDKFETLVKAKGMSIFVRLDHQKNASTVDMKMNEAEVLIFGSPKGGTVLMKQDMGVSLDLPLRVAVYKDKDGKVWLSYHNPQGLKDNYDVAGGAKVMDKVEGALDKLTTAATKAK
ncbi:MAG: DUF302 domain-containing protein [Cocleimonas sp.]